jgi:FkbH-like protein
MRLIQELDRRGVLQSVASRGNESLARQKLATAKLDEILLHPQICWSDKSHSIARIAELLNIGLDSIVLVDDDPFERGEVGAAHPSVRCIGPDELAVLEKIAELPIDHFTGEARSRRAAYKQDERRLLDEASHPERREGFLRDARMQVRLRYATPDDIGRVAELVQRTNQMNTAGRAYSFEELCDFAATRRQHVLVLEYQDVYGALGTVGVAVLNPGDEALTLRLLLVSCRVISRGVGMVFFTLLAQMAQRQRRLLRAEYIPNGRNRPMGIALALSGFTEVSNPGSTLKILELPRTAPLEPPKYFQCTVEVM